MRHNSPLEIGGRSVPQIEVGNVILATGYDLFDARRIPEYGYGELANVFTSLEFERMVNAAGPTGGQIMLLQIVRGFMNRGLCLYLMDEPFAGVHQTIKGTIINAIRTMNRLELVGETLRSALNALIASWFAGPYGKYRSRTNKSGFQFSRLSILYFNTS